MQAVQQWLADHGAVMIGDLPREVEHRLANGEFNDKKFRHIIVDEFQDLTESEARIVSWLRTDGGGLVGLGDKKQSIYSFRGNMKRALDVIQELVSEEVADHTMNLCQRCPREIVSLANAVMALENEPLVSARQENGQSHNIHFKTPSEETSGMAAEIHRVYRSNQEAKHLILVTRRQWGYDLKNEIKRIDPDAIVHTMFAEDVLETWAAREAFIFLSIIGDPEDSASLRDWISYQKPKKDNSAFRAPERNSDAYLRFRETHGTLTMDKVRKIVSGSINLSGRGSKNIILRLTRLYELLGKIPDQGTLKEKFSAALNENLWINPQSARIELEKDDLSRMKREMERLITEAGDNPNALKIIEGLRFQIATKQPVGEEMTAEQGTRIVTLWGAKGLTADYVYIISLCDESLPGFWNTGSSGLSQAEYLDEQRRLLYVSLTRGKKSLVITRAQTIHKGDMLALGLAIPKGTTWHRVNLSVCRFFREIPREILQPSTAFENWEHILT